MCLNADPPKDNSAVIARQEATDREAKIRTGQGQIDNAFGIFDPAYYDKYKKTYEDYYNPQVDKQFGDAKQKLDYNLSRQGIENATEGQRQFGNLIYDYGQKRDQVAGNANDATTQLRGNVEQNKSDLYAQNTASGDPALSAASAVSKAGALSTLGSFAPLGDLFGGLVNTGSAYLYGQQRGLPPGYANAFQPGSTAVGNVRVVG